jgi:hypothetical protein
MPLLIRATTTPIVAVSAIVVAVSALALRLRLSHLGLSPSSFALPDLPAFDPDNRLCGIDVERIGDGDLVYPECLVVVVVSASDDDDDDDQGGGAPGTMFASLGDGRVVRLTGIDEPSGPTWSTVLRTGPSVDALTRGGASAAADEEDEDDDDDYDDDRGGDYGRRCGSGGPSDDHPIHGPSEHICGRPLGMWLSTPSSGRTTTTRRREDDVLLVADAYRGLLSVSGNIYGLPGPGKAEVRVLATRADSDPPGYKFALLNSVLQIPDDSGGDVYMTETSTRFQRRRIFHAVMDGAPDGRLLRYRPKEKTVEVVADGIYMANGLALTHDGTGLLVVSGVRILRYDISSGTLDTTRPFVDAMPGTGDNVKTMDVLPNGERRRCYWVALGGTYKRPFSILKFLSDMPMLRSVLLAIVPYRKLIDLIPKWTALAVYGEDGALIDTLTDDGGTATTGGEDGKATTVGGVTAPWISEAEPAGDYLYLASWYNPFLARIDKRDIKFE